MNSLTKIKDISNKYGVTARTLRYYEDMGLLISVRNEQYAYRMYDESSVKKIEQILILRKLNISIKDIQRIFNSPGSEVVLEVLGKKVKNIDEEVSLLQELKEIVLDFINDIENKNFTNNEDVKLLYNKAKDIETHLTNIDYIGKPSSLNRLLEITDKLDKKVPDIMVVRVPKFRAVTCGIQTWEDMFKPGGYMNQLWRYFHLYKDVMFDCRDFLLIKDNKAEWVCAIKDNVNKNDVKPFDLIDFPGGLYAMAVSIDEDEESIIKVQEKIFKWLDNTNFELDESRDIMFNMPFLDENNEYGNDIERGLGYKQMQRYVPIKLKKGF